MSGNNEIALPDPTKNTWTVVNDNCAEKNRPLSSDRGVNCSSRDAARAELGSEKTPTEATLRCHFKHR